MFPRTSSRTRDLRDVLRASITPCIEALETRRLFNAGLPDPTFGQNGLATSPTTGTQVSAVVQSTGKVVVDVGDPIGSQLERFNTDGSLDPTFSGPSTGSTDFFLTKADLALAPADKLIVVTPGATGQTVTRLNADGSPDATFQAISLPNVVVSAVAVGPDGKVIVAGSNPIATGDAGQAVLYRFNADGSTDATFGQGGHVKLTNDASLAIIDGVVVSATGTITVIGGTYASDYRYGAVYRFDVSGNPLATTFDVPAGASASFSTEPVAVAQAADGSFVVVGAHYIVRYRADGSVAFSERDLGTFGSDSYLSDVSIAADGKILVGGIVVATDEEAYVARYNIDGTPDTTFGDAGSFTDARTTTAERVLPLADGKVLAIGAIAAQVDLLRLTNDAAPTTASVPNRPYALSVTRDSNGLPQVTFYDSATNEAGFILERATSPGGPYTRIAQLAPRPGTGSSISESDDVVVPTTTYYYRVESVAGPYESGFTDPVAFAVGTQAPGGYTPPANAGGAPNAPFFLSVNASGRGGATLSFIDSADNETGFLIRRAVNGARPFTDLATVGPSTPFHATVTYQDATALPDTQYEYEVVALNGPYSSSVAGPVLLSGAANTSGPITAQNPGGAPDGPYALTAAANPVTRTVDLTFYDSATNEAGFVIERSTSPDGPFIQVGVTGPSAGKNGRVVYSDVNTPPGVLYYFRVYAVNGPYQSSIAGPVSATVPVYVAPTVAAASPFATGDPVTSSLLDDSTDVLA